MLDEHRFMSLLNSIHSAVRELEEMTGRPFSPDGHMVGSIGECWAAYLYGLELLPCSTAEHDARCGERLVQIKATYGEQVSFFEEFDHITCLY